MDKEGPAFLRVQFPASGMRQWKLRVIGHWEEDSTSENIVPAQELAPFWSKAITVPEEPHGNREAGRREEVAQGGSRTPIHLSHSRPPFSPTPALPP